jgi:hypothetical protein
VRGHWAIENSLHWVLDVTFGDDQSRLRKCHGAKNMATFRHFALNLVRAAKDRTPSSSAASLPPGPRPTSKPCSMLMRNNLDSKPWSRA